MKVICESPDYSVEQKDDFFLIYNRLFSGNIFTLILTSLLEMFMPDRSTYKIPKCVIINKNDEHASEVITVDKNLNVLGTSDYEYVLIEEQYKKWRLSYFLAAIFTIISSLIIILFVVYIGITTKFNAVLIIPFLVVSIFCFVFTRRIYCEVKAAKELRKIKI